MVGGQSEEWIAEGCLDGQMKVREAERKDTAIFFLCSNVCKSRPVFASHLEELQNKYDLRCAKLPNLLVACAVTFPLPLL